MSCEKHGRTNNVVCPDCDAELVAANEVPSITFLNMTGDITITWDEQNREKVIAMVKKKMAEGYVFFTTKRVPTLRLTRRAKVTERNVDLIDSLIISDEEFEAWSKSMDDMDVASAVREGHAHLSKRQSQRRELDAVKRLKSPEEVVKEQAIAVRPVAGG